jgi:hypothetical protein
MMSIGIIVTVCCSEYELLKITLDAAFSNPAVKAICIVVTDGQPSSINTYSSIHRKVDEHYMDFGHGYDLSIEDGGYDQVAARNYAIESINQHDIEWIVQNDADNIFEDNVYSALSNCGNHSAYICHHVTLLPDSKYWFKPKLNKERFGEYILDPHLFCWKRELNLRYGYCPNAVKLYTNASRHCGLIMPKNLSIFVDTKSYIFHLHCLLKKKHYLQRTESKNMDSDLILKTNEIYSLVNIFLQGRLCKQISIESM